MRAESDDDLGEAGVNWCRWVDELTGGQATAALERRAEPVSVATGNPPAALTAAESIEMEILPHPRPAANLASAAGDDPIRSTAMPGMNDDPEMAITVAPPHAHDTTGAGDDMPHVPGAWVDDDDGDNDDEAATRAMLARMTAQLQRDKTRPVDPDVAADLFNRLRRWGPAHRDDHATSTKDLMKSITPQDDADWWRCQGWSAKNREDFHRASFRAGLLNPGATFLSNSLNYIVAPAIGYATGSHWASFGFGLGIAMITPLMDASQRSGVIEICEQIQERSAPTVKNDKKMIHHKHWPPELAAQTRASAETYAAAGATFASRVNQLLTLQAVGGASDAGPSNTDITEAQIVAMLQAAEPDERADMIRLFEDFVRAENDMESLQRELFMTEAANQNQEIDNNWQAFTRTIRSPASTLVGITRGLTREEMLQAAAEGLEASQTRVARLSAGAAVGVQAAIALAIFGGNMLAAGVGIMQKYEQKNRLNLLFGDYTNDAGEAKAAAGEPLSGDDIDQDKLRKFVLSDLQARVKRLESIIGTKIKDAEAKIAQIEQSASAQLSPEAAAEEGSSISGQAEIDVGILREGLETLRAEKDLLRSGDLESLPLDSLSVALLKGNADHFISKYMTAGIIKKYKKKGELSSQTAQRIGQTWHMIIFGSAAASLVGKLGTAILKGAENASTNQIIGLAVGGLLMGGIGAAYQSAAVNIKNNRRDNASSENPIGWFTQVGRGLIAAPIVVEHAKAMKGANSSVADAITQMANTSNLARTFEGALAEFRSAGAA